VLASFGWVHARIAHTGRRVSSSNVHLYKASDYANIAWPKAEDAQRARAYLEPILRQGTRFVAPNLSAELFIAIAGEHVVPCTRSLEQPAQSYIVSPFTHYITYGAEEISKLKNPALEAPLRGIVTALGGVLQRAHFDRVVYVDNWLTSTSLHPSFTESELKALIHALVQAHPDCAIVLRSVDVRTGRALDAQVRALGARLVFSRRVLFQDPKQAQHRRDHRKDKALLNAALASGAYRVLDARTLDPEGMRRITELYDLLYVGKWSQHNPKLTVAYVTHALACGFLEGQVLVSRSGSIDGVFAAWTRNGLYYVPLLGYDTHLPQSLGLYRMLAALSTEDALERGVLVHDSAGVSDFKQNRGAVPVVEHSAVFDGHLPLARRAPWALLAALMSKVGVPLIEHYDL
jgi:hypothetical protein